MQALPPQNCTPPALFTGSRKQPDVRKWDGSGHTYSHWDGLRRDSDLWFPDGDCFVYLYSKGTSIRGPSFCIPYAAIIGAGYDASQLSDTQLKHSGRSSPSSNSNTSSVDSLPMPRETNRTELFLGAPSLDRNQKFSWHITTRNFFAWLCRKPLVGEDLGLAIEQLLERLQVYGGDARDNIQGLLEYAEEVGYLNFVDHPDHALAMLSFAEAHQVQSLYVDAFAHCVGMKDKLETCSGYSRISSLSKALMSRAHLEMDLHIERAALSIGNFMDEELSATYLALTKNARAHLDTFRSFLHTYCVAKHGYWPPSRTSTYSRTLYQSMHQDFRALYDYLADKETWNDLEMPQTAASGSSVLKDIDAFNDRHQYQALPYSIPLTPLLSTLDDAFYGQRSRRSSWFGFNNNNHNEIQRVALVRNALYLASNREDAALVSCPLVQAYRRFESEQASSCEEDISVTDARKVRWILIYAMLQTLSSVTHAPAEVRMASVTPYPLCCLTTGTPPWKSNSSTERLSKSMTTISDNSSFSSPSTPGISTGPTWEPNGYFHSLPTNDSGSLRSSSVSSAIIHRQLSVASLNGGQHFVRRSSMRQSSIGSGLPPAIPTRRRESRPSTRTNIPTTAVPTSKAAPRLPLINTDNQPTSVPGLDWTSEFNDRLDFSSDDDNSSPDVDGTDRYPSFDPFHDHLLMPSTKDDQGLSEARVRNSLDAILDNLLDGNGLFHGMAL